MRGHRYVDSPVITYKQNETLQIIIKNEREVNTII